MNKVILNFLKASEGGMSQRAAKEMLTDNGIKAQIVPSIYVGHSAVEVPARQQKKAARLLWGR